MSVREQMFACGLDLQHAIFLLFKVPCIFELGVALRIFKNMSEKNFVLVDENAPAAEEKGVVIDWGLCVLCQKSTPENLVDPEKTTEDKKYDGYATLAANLVSFHDIGELSSLPFKVDLSALDNLGSGLFNTLKNKSAKYHKSCKTSCSESKLTRARKRAQNT